MSPPLRLHPSWSPVERSVLEELHRAMAETAAVLGLEDYEPPAVETILAERRAQTAAAVAEWEARYAAD